MPTEAQLKAQMQAAIAKKKLEAVKAKPKPVETIKDVVEAVTPIATPPIAAPEPPPPAPSKPAVEIVADRSNAVDHHAHTDEAEPVGLSFYGQSVRFTTHKQDVYFAVIDLLPLSKHPDYLNLLIDFKNNPKTKDKANSLMKILTFSGPKGSERLDGAMATDLLAIFRDLKLTFPGPMGRWLRETALLHKPTTE